MLYTDNYNLNLPEKNEQFNIEHFNDNSRAIDEQLKINSDDIDTVNERLLEEIQNRESANDTLQSNIDLKLNKNQGSSNQGKVMGVSDNGELKPSGLYHKTYTTLAELGLTADATVNDVMNKLGVGENCIIRTDNFNDYLTKFENIQYGYLQITKTVNGLCEIWLNDVINMGKLYYGRQSAGKFQNWEKVLIDLNNRVDLKFNSKTFKIDITKGNENWNGNMKFGYCVDESYGEIIISSLGKTEVLWDCSTGVRYVKSVTYTIDPNNKAHITIGVEFYETVYGIHQLDVIGNFARINSVTRDAFTGTSVAKRGATRGRNNGVGILCDVADLGLTTPCTTVQIAQAMRNLASGMTRIPESGMIGVFDNGGNKITDAPSEYGLLQINMHGYDRIMIRYDGVGRSTYNGSWIGKIKGSNGTFSGITWERIISGDLDPTITKGSTNPPTSNAVYVAIKSDLDNLNMLSVSQTTNSSVFYLQFQRLNSSIYGDITFKCVVNNVPVTLRISITSSSCTFSTINGSPIYLPRVEYNIAGKDIILRISFPDYSDYLLGGVTVYGTQTVEFPSSFVGGKLQFVSPGNILDTKLPDSLANGTFFTTAKDKTTVYSCIWKTRDLSLDTSSNDLILYLDPNFKYQIHYLESHTYGLSGLDYTNDTLKLKFYPNGTNQCFWKIDSNSLNYYVSNGANGSFVNMGLKYGSVLSLWEMYNSSQPSLYIQNSKHGDTNGSYRQNVQFHIKCFAY